MPAWVVQPENGVRQIPGALIIEVESQEKL